MGKVDVGAGGMVAWMDGWIDGLIDRCWLLPVVGLTNAMHETSRCAARF